MKRSQSCGVRVPNPPRRRVRLVWPPKVGQRIHLDTGHPHNSWSAEVRAIVDGDYAVIRRWQKHKGWHRYGIIDSLDVSVWGDDATRGYFVGPLPKRPSDGRSPSP